MVLSVLLLGEAAIVDASGATGTRSMRAVELVGFLVAHSGAPQSRQRLAMQFWPDSTDAQALTNLRRELHHLRQVLNEDPALVVSARQLTWDDSKSCRVDVADFRREIDAALAAEASDDTAGLVHHGMAAIQLYRGEFMPGSYDEWVFEVRAALEEACIAMCRRVSRALAKNGELARAKEVAKRRIALQPLEEEAYFELMAIQAELGDRAGAVSTYHRCASALERELGLDPGRAMQDLLQKMLIPEQRRRSGPAAESTERPRLGGAASAFVGRAHELRTLTDVWQAAVAGEARLVIIDGPAGVGKTRLVGEIAGLGREQGAVVAVGQCFGTSGRLALAPVADWLRHPSIQEAATSLDPVWRVELERLAPVGAERSSADVGLRSVADAWQQHRFFEGLARSLVQTSQPLLLIIDNLQWCDQETLDFVAFCLQFAPNAPLLIGATRRDDNPDRSDSLSDWIRRMRATGRLTEVRLSPLDESDTGELATAIAGRPLSAEDVGLLTATTGGFPLFVIEAIRAGDPRGGGATQLGDLTQVLQSRLDQASNPAREVAALAAAVGRNFNLDLLTEASDLTADEVVGAVDELWRRRILHELVDGYDFSHDLLRDQAYAQATPARRWLLHRRLAQSLELLHQDDLESVTAELADQYARGGHTIKALAYYRQAAQLAARVFAHNEAIRLHRDALRLVASRPAGTDRDRQELTILRGLAAPLTARSGYSSPEVERALDRSIDLARRLNDTESRIEALLGLWSCRFVQGRNRDAHATAGEVMALVAPGTSLAGSASFARAGSAVSLGHLSEAVGHFEVAFELTVDAEAWPVGNRPDVHSRGFAAHAYWLLGEDDNAKDIADEAIALARRIDNPYCLAIALAYAGIFCQLSDDRAALDVVVEELTELCKSFDFGYYREWALILGGWSVGGEAGLASIRQGIDHLRAEGSFARMPYWLTLLADTTGQLGRQQESTAILDAALVAGQARDDLWWLPEVLRQRARYDSPAQARKRLTAAVQMARDQDSVALVRRCENDLASANVRAGVRGPVNPNG
jgi:DNA-binding SARP family transcriptional activator/tetratricopeptide (TPR) repeat protein